MVIRITKHEGKPPTLSCVRGDGSTTWQSYGNQRDFFPIHDLTHYAVETELGYRHGFYGMIAAGRGVNDFGSGDAASFHPEAIYAECLAGLLTTTFGVGSNLTYEEIKKTLDGQTEEARIPPIELSPEQFTAIRAKTATLVQRWREMPLDAFIELEWPLT